ncbi:hypothetical protein MRB53_038640 [Persea americana]|nr:hypothetical protein MRB53_038640 [Persea americana]
MLLTRTSDATMGFTNPRAGSLAYILPGLWASAALCCSDKPYNIVSQLLLSGLDGQSSLCHQSPNANSPRGMTCFATLGTTTAISAYVLDVFPRHAALASAWICAFRTIGGFCVVYFQVKWIASDGPAVVFGSQAGIVGAAIVSIVATQVFGMRWRKRFAL